MGGDETVGVRGRGGRGEAARARGRPGGDEAARARGRRGWGRTSRASRGGPGRLWPPRDARDVRVSQGMTQGRGLRHGDMALKKTWPGFEPPWGPKGRAE